MNVPMKLCVAILGGTLAIGCGEETDDTTTTPPPGSTPTAPQATGTDPADDMATDTGNAVDSLQRDAQAGADAAQDSAQQAGDALKAGANDAGNQLSGAEASTQVQQVMTYIKENKLELAETSLQKLEANKASLPAAVQPQVDRARQMLDAAKQSGGSTGTTTPPADPAQAPAPAPGI